jgi:cytochrome P450
MTTQQQPPMTDLSRLPLPPGSTGLPLLGETLAFLRGPRPFAQERQRRHGNVFRTHLFGGPAVMMMGSDAARWVFAGENKYLYTRWAKGTRQVLPTQSITSLMGEAHQARRRLLAPHFTPTQLRGLMPGIQAIAARHLAEWASRPGVLTVRPAMSTLIFDAAVGFLLGDAPVDVARMNRLFKTWTQGLFTAVPLNAPFTTHGRSLAAKRELLSLLDGVVAGREKLASQPGDVLGSLLSVRDEQGQPLTREAVVDELLLQLMASHDNTMSTLANIVLLFSQHPEVLQRCRDEQRGASLDEPITLERLRDFPFLHQVIQEGLRFIPPVGGLMRVTTQDVEFGGYRIPKGWRVMLSLGATHHMTPWTEPGRFEPERMGPGRAEHQQQPHCFIPFGGGARSCLGQHFALAEMAIVLALLVRGYRWELVPGQDLSFTPIPFPHPRSGIQVHFSRL